MTNEQKIEISAAATKYMQEKKLTAAAFSGVCGVSQSYLSNILNGTFTIGNDGDKVTEIADKYFAAIADAVGFAIKKNYWPHVNTREFVEIVSVLQKSKNEHLMTRLIIDTGAGKTYAINQFRKQNPLYTYVLTIHNLMKVSDLFADLIDQMKISSKGAMGYRRAQCLMKLRDVRRNGGTPIVIIDEGENMNTTMRGMIKGFVDGVMGYASIVLVGTHQLLDIMREAKAKDKQAGPQLERRFKAGTRIIKISATNAVRFKPFFDKLGIEDGLRKLLCELCENYGELHDYLVPALMEADARGVELTEQFFRLVNNMPEMSRKS